MASNQVVKMSVIVIINSPSQDYTHLDDHASLTYYMRLGSNYRMQGHFGPPHFHVSERFEEQGITQ